MRRFVLGGNINKNDRSGALHFHGLDTFAGMPANYEGNATFAQGTYLSSYSDVLTKCKDAGMSIENFTLHEGLFAETTPDLFKILSTKIAIVSIDYDIYS